MKKLKEILMRIDDLKEERKELRKFGGTVVANVMARVAASKELEDAVREHVVALEEAVKVMRDDADWSYAAGEPNRGLDAHVERLEEL